MAARVASAHLCAQESVGATLHNIGVACHSMGEDDKAMRCFREALEVQKAVLGEKNVSF